MRAIDRRHFRSKNATRKAAALCLAVGFGVCAGGAAAQVQLGIAAAYPGDVGIGEDPRIVYFEDFETGTVADLRTRWEQVVTGAGITLPNDAPADGAGRRSVQLTARGGVSDGSQLYTRLPTALDTVYVRYYVKYTTGSGASGHSGLWLGGYNPSTGWPQGGAGIRPQGNDTFSLTYQPFGTTRMDFYAYWMGMSGLPNGYYWGNSFLQNPNLRPDFDDWMCIEIMLRGNQPVSASNGELRLWVNGVPTMHMGQGFPRGYDDYGVFTPNPNGPPWRGFQWRNSTALKNNFVWLNMYEPELGAGVTTRLLFDQVAVATEYIGPIVRDVPEPGLAVGLMAGALWLTGVSRAAVQHGRLRDRVLADAR